VGPVNPPSFGMRRQLDLYSTEPAQPVLVERLRARAAEVLDPRAWGYLEGAAGSEDTARANLEAFRRWRIVPRVLRGVERPDLGIDLLGQRLRSPLLLAPIGVQGILHPHGELAVARAAAALGVPMVLSSASSSTLEDVAATLADQPRWFQLYWSRDREFAASLLGRAASAGYSAVVVTLDTMQLGWRPRDLDQAYLPFLEGEGLANYLSDPVFRAGLDRTPEADPAAARRRFSQLFADPSLTWDDLPFLREHTALPILLKGVLHPDDARRSIDCGADGVIVSNHGGRQIDGAIAALDALPDVVSAIGGRVPVLFDSGIRQAADVVKAIALGARAALVGRPYAYGLAVRGEDGVRDVLHNLLAELDLTLSLGGWRSPAEIGRDAVVRDPTASGSPG